MGSSGLLSYLDGTSIDPGVVAQYLDGVAHDVRLREVLSLPRPLYRPWFEACADAQPLSLDALVPNGAPALGVVVFHGMNSMPLFRSFQKPMYRAADGTVCGRNATPWEWFAGPGYFTVTPGEDASEVWIDYTRLPKEKPAVWPTIYGNSRGGSFFVFRGLRDRLRRAAREVFIGHALRNGKPLSQYFVLVREPAKG